MLFRVCRVHGQMQNECGAPSDNLHEANIMTSSNSNDGKPTAQDPDTTFETDISETDDEGTTVRQAEVDEKDLNESKDAP